MPYLVLLMEALTAAWFITMIAVVRDQHNWSLTVVPARLDDVGRAIQTSAKWAFPVGMAALLVLTVAEIAREAVF